MLPMPIIGFMPPIIGIMLPIGIALFIIGIPMFELFGIAFIMLMPASYVVRHFSQGERPVGREAPGSFPLLMRTSVHGLR